MAFFVGPFKLSKLCKKFGKRRGVGGGGSTYVSIRIPMVDVFTTVPDITAIFIGAQDVTEAVHY